MSTNSECAFVETAPGQWYYILEHYHAPKNAWDWREHADLYGPFASEEIAVAHLDRHHANPGGWSTHPYQPGDEAKYAADETFQSLLKRKREREARISSLHRW